MHTAGSTPPAAALPQETANDRLKRRAVLWQWNAIVVAAAVHFALFALWPQMSAGVTSRTADETTLFELPEVDYPLPPDRIARPAPPVIVTGPVDPDVEFAPIPWDRPDLLPPPPAARGSAPREKFTHLVPSMVPPEVLNRAEVERALQRHYPPTLRDAGIGGDVSVLLWLDERGTIVQAEIGESSGREAFDRAALEVVKVMRLSPALNMNRPTPVIVSLPVRFSAR